MTAGHQKPLISLTFWSSVQEKAVFIVCSLKATEMPACTLHSSTWVIHRKLSTLLWVFALWGHLLPRRGEWIRPGMLHVWNTPIIFPLFGQIITNRNVGQGKFKNLQLGVKLLRLWSHWQLMKQSKEKYGRLKLRREKREGKILSWYLITDSEWSPCWKNNSYRGSCGREIDCKDEER